MHDDIQNVSNNSSPVDSRRIEHEVKAVEQEEQEEFYQHDHAIHNHGEQEEVPLESLRNNTHDDSAHLKK